jgi:hypothetical protein
MRHVAAHGLASAHLQRAAPALNVPCSAAGESGGRLAAGGRRRLRALLSRLDGVREESHAPEGP